jgi:hypothetical protein
MSVLSVATAVISIIGQIARSPVLSGEKAEKIGALIGDLTDTASVLLQRGEEGAAELGRFKTELKQLRSDLASGEVTSTTVVDRIRSMRGRSDAAHDKLQALKPPQSAATPGSAPTGDVQGSRPPAGTSVRGPEPAPLPPAGDAGGGATPSSTVVETGGGQRTIRS